MDDMDDCMVAKTMTRVVMVGKAVVSMDDMDDSMIDLNDSNNDCRISRIVMVGTTGHRTGITE